MTEQPCSASNATEQPDQLMSWAPRMIGARETTRGVEWAAQLLRELLDDPAARDLGEDAVYEHAHAMVERALLDAGLTEALDRHLDRTERYPAPGEGLADTYTRSTWLSRLVHHCVLGTGAPPRSPAKPAGHPAPYRSETADASRALTDLDTAVDLMVMALGHPSTTDNERRVANDMAHNAAVKAIDAYLAGPAVVLRQITTITSDRAAAAEALAAIIDQVHHMAVDRVALFSRSPETQPKLIRIAATARPWPDVDETDAE